MTKTRITQLSALNVDALRQTHRDLIDAGELVLTATTAEWTCSGPTALVNLDARMDGLPTRGHPRASLHAVRRKLDKIAAAQYQESHIPIPGVEEEDTPGVKDDNTDEHYKTMTEIQAEIDAIQSETDPGPILPLDPIADFLLDGRWENLYEQTDSTPGAFGPFRCIGCDLVVPARARERHFLNHKENRATMAKTQTTPKNTKPAKPTAKDQGVPAVYLGANGNFKPGMDARLKSDLVNTILGLDTKGALATFTVPAAQKLIDARGWQSFVERKKEIVAAKAEAQAKAAADKAERVRAAAQEKQSKGKGKEDTQGNGDLEAQVATEQAEYDAAQAASTGKGEQVKPDPKPATAKKTGRGRK